MAIPSRTRFGAYEIVSLLGAGGMGEVYRAVDTRLGRDVAIKVLSAADAKDPQLLDRMTREARAASALSHQNIAHIYEVGDVDGRRFIAMEYVEGATLETAGRAWPIDGVVDAGVQLADGLDAAHRKGIVHRDIKPSNLMLTPRGELKILDFGVAKVDSGSVSAHTLSTVGATNPGAVVGTVGAFSPEQALGRDVDARADLFSAGVVLYELATGRPPFAGATPVETADRLLHTTPEMPSHFNAAVPPLLDRIILKCLEKDRERRYQSAADLRVDLDALRRGASTSASEPASRVRRPWRLIAASAVALLIGATIAVVFLRPAGAGAIDSVAVLPFANDGADSQAEYLSDGVPDALIDALSQVPALRVIALSSTLRYKTHPADAKQIGAELGARAVVTGRVRQQGSNVTIALEVVDTRDDRHLWGRRYTRTIGDFASAPGEFARDVADALRGRLSDTEIERLTRRQTADTEAYRLYLQGRYFWNRYSENGFNKAIEYFHQAIARDPSYALAWAGLADAEMQLGVDFLSPDATFPQGRQYAERALQLDPSLGEAHASLGIYAMWYERDWAGAEREYTRAIQLRPNDPVAHHFYAHYLDARGRIPESFAEIQRALDLDPMSPFLMEEAGFTYYHAGRLDEAARWEKRALDLDPRFDFGMFALAQTYVASGAYGDAAALFDRASGLADWYGVESERAALLALTGRPSEARRLLERLLARGKSEYVDPYAIAIVYVALGNRDDAFEWLNRAIDAHSAYAAFFNGDPKLAPLHGDKQFSALIARMGL